VQKLYIIVDSHLSKSQQAVQGAHVVAEYLITNPKTEWNNGTIILLKHSELEILVSECDALFREPDLNNKLTAIAFHRCEGWFNDLRLV